MILVLPSIIDSPEDSLRCVLFELFDSFPDTVLCCGGAECMPSKSENIFSCSKVLIDAGVVGRSGSSYAVAVLSSPSGGLASRSAIDFVKVEDGSSISAMAADGEKAGELGDIEDCIFTNESSGLPSSSGSGRNFEEKERPRPLPVVSEPPGDIIYPAGEKPPDRAAELTSTMRKRWKAALTPLACPGKIVMRICGCPNASVRHVIPLLHLQSKRSCSGVPRSSRDAQCCSCKPPEEFAGLE